MKTLLLATAVAAAFAAPAHSGSRAPTSPDEAPQSLQAAFDGGFLNRADADRPDPWGEDAKEWTCPMPKPTKGDGDRDPIYKTEIFLTYNGEDRIATLRSRRPIRRHSHCQQQQPTRRDADLERLLRQEPEPADRGRA
jgi:hypothetical protein